MTPNESVAKALFEFDQPNNYRKFGDSFGGILEDEYRLLAFEAIEALRADALERVRRLSLEQQLMLYGSETAIINAILGPPRVETIAPSVETGE